MTKFYSLLDFKKLFNWISELLITIQMAASEIYDEREIKLNFLEKVDS